MTTAGEKSGLSFLALGFGTFVLFGASLVLVGATYENMSVGLALSIDQMALLGASLSIGIGAGVVIAGPLVDRLPRRPLFVAATGIAALALLSVERDIGFARAVLHVVAMGFGGGLCETLINAMTVERFGTRAIRPLTILHSAATLGAVGTPALIGMLIANGDWTSSFRALGAGFSLIAVWALFVPLQGALAPATDGGTRGLLSPGVLALCAIAFAYVGIEAGITLFSVPYATDGLGLSADRGRVAISSFWFGLLIGRLALAIGSSRADPNFLLGAGLGAALIIGMSVGLGWDQIEVMVGLTGAAVGLVFPVMVTLAGEWCPESRGTATGLVIGVGCLGGFAVPWLTGVIAEGASVSIAMGSFAVWGLAIAIFAFVARSIARRESAAKPT